VNEALLGIVTGGPGDARRLRTLCSAVPHELIMEEVDRSRPRRESARRVRETIASRDWPLVVLEGTGITGGLGVINAARRRGVRYIVSSGDPIGGFFRTVRGPVAGFAFERYERALYRHSAGYVGWSPYLTGMAIRMGAPRGATIEGGVDLRAYRVPTETDRNLARETLGIPPNDLVVGVVGSLTWSRQGYCYGLELVEALRRVRRNDVSVLIVGDGDGRPHLEARVPEGLSSRVRFTGRLPSEEVPRALHALDVGFVTQTIDGLGSYRLTTKLPEYLASGVPVAMSPIPGYFDYVGDAGWPLPVGHPADPTYHELLAGWIDRLDRPQIAMRRPLARAAAESRFDYDLLSRRFALFVDHVLSLPR
jgi:glycosyltransferase involved in cell wall biosynthesis